LDTLPIILITMRIGRVLHITVISLVFSGVVYITLLFSLLFASYLAIKKGSWSDLEKTTYWVNNLTEFSNHTGIVFSPIKIIYHSNRALLHTIALGKSLENLFFSITNIDNSNFELAYDQFYRDYVGLKNDISFLTAQSWLNSLLNQSKDLKFAWNYYQQNNEYIDQVIMLLPNLLGSDGEKHYTVLLQNNTEIRPTGGFMGSYVTFYFSKGKLINYEVSDIYVPDGAITGHIEAPNALQVAFGHGTWKLRDSNWDSDFPKAAQTIDWFLERGGAGQRDGIVAVNLEVVEKLIEFLGKISVGDYKIILTKDNLYQTAQHQAEMNFFPGSTAKKDFLQQATNQLLAQVKLLNHNQMVQLFEIIYHQFIQKNIQLYFKDPQTQSIIAKLNWDGAIDWKKSNKGIQDYLYISEANLGANKANCCIFRASQRKVTFMPDKVSVKHLLKIDNQNTTDRPAPPEIWGGDYRNFIRFYIPSFVQNVSFAVDENKVETEKIEITKLEDSDVTSYGLFVEIPHQKSKVIMMSYDLPREKDVDYSLYFQKQSGIDPYQLLMELTNSRGVYQSRKELDRDQTMLF